ncbi:hypothetical protein L2E82_42472 [Cichorium intybus]|uniref:Uncharacterized protein n=1 Tax=Cichorium intybus TaxID=13427 RepID=A0ACB8ZL66_CICIN|nr:hypothetical protein L2E82_42472 [Cichorium intybus]
MKEHRSYEQIVVVKHISSEEVKTKIKTKTKTKKNSLDSNGSDRMKGKTVHSVCKSDPDVCKSETKVEKKACLKAMTLEPHEVKVPNVPLLDLIHSIDFSRGSCLVGGGVNVVVGVRRFRRMFQEGGNSHATGHSRAVYDRDVMEKAGEVIDIEKLAKDLRLSTSYCIFHRLRQPALLTISLRPTQLPHRKRLQTFEDEEIDDSRYRYPLPVLHMQQYFSVAEFFNALQQATWRRQQQHRGGGFYDPVKVVGQGKDYKRSGGVGSRHGQVHRDEVAVKDGHNSTVEFNTPGNVANANGSNNSVGIEVLKSDQKDVALAKNSDDSSTKPQVDNNSKSLDSLSTLSESLECEAKEANENPNSKVVYELGVARNGNGNGNGNSAADIFESQNVVNLTRTGIENLVKMEDRNDAWMVVLYAPWCPFCQPKLIRIGLQSVPRGPE